MDYSSSYHRLISTLSWADDLCSLGGFPCFVPGALKAREFNYSLLIFEEDRLCQAVVTLHASTALASSSKKELEKSHLGGSLIVVGIETRTILVKSNEV